MKQLELFNEPVIDIDAGIRERLDWGRGRANYYFTAPTMLATIDFYLRDMLNTGAFANYKIVSWRNGVRVWIYPDGGNWYPLPFYKHTDYGVDNFMSDDRYKEVEDFILRHQMEKVQTYPQYNRENPPRP